MARRRQAIRSAAAVTAALAALGLPAGCGEGAPRPPLAPATGESGERGVDPLAYGGDDAALSARAAAGHSHVLYVRSPDGVRATARRVERFRGLVEAAARHGDVDPDVLEAIVFLESAGRPEVIAGDDPENASGLTQILAETGSNLLGMRIDLARSRALTRRYARERRRGRPGAAAAALRARRRADERFVPARALAATVRYLRLAREELGRDDLAVVSYHMGIGNLQGVLRAYGEDDVSYPRLYFDSTPLRHGGAWRRLAALSDESSTYWWRVLAAREIMRLHRREPERLADLDEAHNAKGSAEEVLHPPGDTKVFDDPGDVREAREDGELVALPPPARLFFRRDRRMGQLAGRLKASPALYHALRPEAVALAAYLGAGVQRISGERLPLVMTSAVRDRRYQELLIGINPEATSGFSVHTTGFAFDVLRRYRSPRQAMAFEFLLDRLQSLNLVAWVREPAAIHVAVSRDAKGLVPFTEG